MQHRQGCSGVPYAAFAAQLKQGYSRVKKKLKGGGPDLVKAVADHEAALQELVTEHAPTSSPHAGASRSDDGPNLSGLGSAAEAVAQLNLARMHRAAGNRLREARCYRRASLLLTQRELQRYENGTPTLDQDLVKAVMACNFAISVLQRLDSSDALIEAYCLSMHMGEVLERLSCVDAAASYYSIASGIIQTAAESRSVAAALHEGSTTPAPTALPASPPQSSLGAEGAAGAASTPEKPAGSSRRGDGSCAGSASAGGVPAGLPGAGAAPTAAAASALQHSADVCHLRCLWCLWDVEAALAKVEVMTRPFLAKQEALQAARQRDAQGEGGASPAPAAAGSDVDEGEGEDADSGDGFFEVEPPAGFHQGGGPGGASPAPSSLQGVVVCAVLATLALRDPEGSRLWLGRLEALAPSASPLLGTLQLLWRTVSCTPPSSAVELPVSPPFTSSVHVAIYHKLRVSLMYPLCDAGD